MLVTRQLAPNVATGGYYRLMKMAGVREFKDQLSAYLREVQAGETVVVTDRGRVIAEVRRPGAARQSLSPQELREKEAIESGFLTPPIVPAEERQARLEHLLAEVPGPFLPREATEPILDALRDDKPL